MSTRRRPHGGFTLVELLMIVVILAMTASVALLSSGGGDAQALDLATIQIQDTVERAQALAQSQRVAHGVVFDLASNQLALVNDAGVAVDDPLTKMPMVIGFATPGQPQGIDITGADFGTAGTTALFDPQGVPLAAGTVTLSRGSVTRTLTFDGATGRIE